jgi:hypothetical protein
VFKSEFDVGRVASVKDGEEQWTDTRRQKPFGNSTPAEKGIGFSKMAKWDDRVGE